MRLIFSKKAFHRGEDAKKFGKMYGGVVLSRGLTIRSRQVGKESFTNAFSINRSTVNIKMFYNYGETHLKIKP